MVSFFGCFKSQEQKAKDFSHQLAEDLIKKLKEQMSFLEIRGRRGVEATYAACFDIENTFHKRTDHYKTFQNNLADPLLSLSQFGLKNHQKEPLQKYVTNHLALQILACILQTPFIKPKFVERSTDIYRPQVTPEESMMKVRLKTIFWNNIDPNHYTETDVKVLTITYEDLILNALKKLDPNKMVQNAFNDYKAEYVALMSRITTWQMNADFEAEKRAEHIMPRH